MSILEYDFLHETAYAEFHDGALLEGYAIYYDYELEDWMPRDFSITFHTDNSEGSEHRYFVAISEIELFCWNQTTNIFYAGGLSTYAVNLNSAKIFIEDTLALKSDLNETSNLLDTYAKFRSKSETEKAGLKITIATLSNPYYP